MIPGYLHLDCRRGFKADLLNAALWSLLSDDAMVKKAIASLGIDGLDYEVFTQTQATITGQTLKFHLGNEPIKAETAKDRAATIFSNDVVSLYAIKQWLEQKPLTPCVMALSQKILAQLFTTTYCEHNLKAQDALWLVCHIVMFSALIDALDPKFITATKICLSEQRSLSLENVLSLTDSQWLNHLLIGMPAYEIGDAIVVDVCAVACVKALAGHIGARGESRIRKIGIGLSAGTSLLSPNVFEALWCEPHLPESMTELGFNNYAKLDSLHEIVGVISATADVLQITSSLSMHGAMSLTWHLAQRDKNSSCYVVRFLVRDEDKRDAMEAFLVKGGATSVTMAVVERHELNKRLVNVPIGTGNKAFTARFFEYLYLDKTVRVEPLKEDLDSYAQRTDYSVDVARSDLMLAWKKWRGRVVMEDA